MDLQDSKAWTRRAFLHNGMVLASSAATVPWFVQRSAFAAGNPSDEVSSRAGVPEERVLVVVQLAGGNDGLNTVVPFGDPAYYRARGTIGISESQVLSVDRREGLGLHPSLEGLKGLFDEGVVSIIQGVGYPNPNRSHFKSMDIWHTADTAGVGDGWIGRYFDNTCAGEPGGCSGHAGVAIGRSAPLAMQGRRFKPVSFETEQLFRWSGRDLHGSLEDPYDRITRSGQIGGVDADSSAAFLMRTALDAQIASGRIREAVDAKPLVRYPRGDLARQLAMVAAMIRAELKTRVYYVTLGGFDTHARQGAANGVHANLLGQLGDALKAFYADLSAQGNEGRVLTMTFSEFGRRVSQNGSGGTDHGAAAPMFLLGPMVRPGVLGDHPSLTDLDAGDLKFGVDFRSVYASIVDDWLGADARAVLGRPYREAKVLRVRP